MEGYILRDGKEQLTLSTAAADKLLQSGQGDAALLYLALCRFGRGVTPEELERASAACASTRRSGCCSSWAFCPARRRTRRPPRRRSVRCTRLRTSPGC